ncbi:heterokaryon incompatibility protein-domain-containing protein [Tricladium varicosporioides]|nr:heterokaryon incompatibility protein-domain-containing protein [Hymenoscyphus varicosporioides]
MRSRIKIYKYSSLKEGHIRLLHVYSSAFIAVSLTSSSPAAASKPSRASYEIVHVALQHAPLFEAVSYVWGNAKRSKSLALPKEQQLPITESVSEALRFLVQAQKTGYLWIDQICIDQQNIAERGYQVEMMGNIYTRANRVIVWLGPGLEIFKPANNVFHEYESLVASIRAWNDDALYERDALVKRLLLTSTNSSQNRRAILEVLKLPWFERAWIFQEFVLARQVCMLLGEFKFDAYTLFFITCRMRDMSRQRDTILQNHEISYLRVNHPLQIMVNVNSNREEIYFFLSRMAERCKAFDQRDLVYAFLSLNPDPRINIKPNYSLSVRDIFISTARSIINGTKSLDIFAVAPREHNSIWRKKQSWVDPPPLLPSWVPNWCYRASSVPLFYPRGRVQFQASSGRPYAPSNSTPISNPDCLIVRGKSITKIHAISQSQTGLGSRKNIQAYLRLDEQASLLQPILSSLQFKSIQGMSSRQNCEANNLTRSSLLRLSIADGTFLPHLSEPLMNDDHKFRPTGVLTEEHIARLLDIYDNESRNNNEIDMDDFWERDLWLLLEYALVARRRRIFVTSEGKLGLGSEKTKVGDDVALIHGSATPLILREKAVDNKKSYEFIGQCYLEDAMYGEACTWKESETDEITII